MAYYVYFQNLPTTKPGFPSQIELPLGLSGFRWSIKNQNRTVVLINESEINIPKLAGLSSYYLEFIIPQVKHHFQLSYLPSQPAAYYFNIFDEIKESAKPFTFTLARHKPTGDALMNTGGGDSGWVTLETFSANESPEDLFDFRVSMELKRWKAYGPKTLTPLPDGSFAISEIRELLTAPSTEFYTTIEGDTLWSIAKLLLGDGERWQDILELNSDRIIDPVNLEPGIVLVMPGAVM
jgi:hypothetical protein